jgi:hypothetical protein
MKSIRTHLAALLFFALLALLFTFPLVLHLDDSVVGSQGDNLYFIWLIRWYQRAFFEGGGHPFFNPDMNYPEGWNLSTTDTTLATALPGSVFSLLVGPVAGYNLAMLLTFALSGWAMFAWVRHLTGSTSAALVAGVIFAFLPYRIAHFRIGHLNLSGTQWLPLYFWGLYSLVKLEARRYWQPAVLAGLSLGAIAFTSMYYLYFALLISAVFVPVVLIMLGWRQVRQPALWRQAGLFLLVAVPLVLLALRPFLILSGAGTIADREWEYARMYSASPADFLLPSTDHFLVGRWVGEHFNRDLWPEATLYIGLTSLVLAGVAVARARADRQRALIAAAVTAAALAFLLALGTDLHWNAQPIHGPDGPPMLLPGYWLFHHLPFYAKMRALMRVGLFALLFASLLAGLGADRLLRGRSPRARAALTVLLVGLVLFEFYPGPYSRELSPIPSRPVDAWLADQPGEGAVVQFPFPESEDQAQMLYSLVHQKSFVGGFFNANRPPQYQYISPILNEFPSNSQILPLLRDLRVEWVLVDTAAYPDLATLDDGIAGLGLKFDREIAGQRIYRLPPEAAP